MAREAPSDSVTFCDSMKVISISGTGSTEYHTAHATGFHLKVGSKINEKPLAIVLQWGLQPEMDLPIVQRNKLDWSAKVHQCSFQWIEWQSFQWFGWKSSFLTFFALYYLYSATNVYSDFIEYCYDDRPITRRVYNISVNAGKTTQGRTEIKARVTGKDMHSVQLHI